MLIYKNKKKKFFMNNDLKSYKKNGFVILRGCIENQLILDIQSYAADLLECKPDIDSITKTMEVCEMKDHKIFFEFTSRMGDIIPVIKIATQPKILSLVEEITKFKNLYLAESAVFYNKETVKRLQYDWHQEQAYFPNASEVITLWYPWLTPVNNANGTMVMASGGNKKIFERERVNVSNGLTQMKIQDDD